MQLINTVDPTIHLAIELSASSWLIAARVPGSEKPYLHRIVAVIPPLYSL